jgi:hypothetical protein
MIPLAPYLGIGWIPHVAAPQAYLHKGYIYITGAIENERASGEGEAATSTIASGLPTFFRPSVARKVYLPILPATTDACNVSLNLGLIWASTVHPDGSWTLDEALPYFLNIPPSAIEWRYEDGLLEETKSYPQYTDPLRLALALGNARWLLDVEPDEPALKSLAADVGSEFTDAGAEYAEHGSRIHLAGGVTANGDGAIELLAATPPGTTDTLPRPFGDFTTAISSGNPVALQVFPGLLELSSDNPIVPVGDTPPLAFFKRQLHGEGPKSVPGEFVYEKTLFGGIAVCGLPECPPEIHVQECGVELPHVLTIPCDVEALLAGCLPLPPWFLVRFGMTAQLGTAIGTAGARALYGFGEKIECPKTSKLCPPLIGTLTNVPDGCPPERLATHIKISEGPPCYDGAGLLIPPTEGETTAHQAEGYLKPPESLYKGVTHLSAGYGEGVDSSLFWTPAQVTNFTVAITQEGMHEEAVLLGVQVLPFYERRQIGLHAGDALDLTLTGWEGAGLNMGVQRKGQLNWAPR